MRPTLISAPATEPVSLADAKTWLRVDATEEDDLVQALIVAARMTLEAATRRFFVTQSWRLVFDAWPDCVRETLSMSLPFTPFQSVAAIRLFDRDGGVSVVSPSSYRAPLATDNPRIVYSSAPDSPGRSTDGIEIDIIVGYGALPADTPEPLRRAMLMTMARAYENRGDADIPRAALALAAPFRRERLI